MNIIYRIFSWWNTPTFDKKIPVEEPVPEPPPFFDQDAAEDVDDEFDLDEQDQRDLDVFCHNKMESTTEMLWVLEVFDPEFSDPDNLEELIADPPLLYGPHTDPLEAMAVLEEMLESLNAHEGVPFRGRVRPIFTHL